MSISIRVPRAAMINRARLREEVLAQDFFAE
jgi:hypothetical protein